jgi:uncharacterized alkaline shock family protein YloU
MMDKGYISGHYTPKFVDDFLARTPTDDSTRNLGEIKINHSVIANIATLSAMPTKSVLGVGTHGFASGIASFFSSKKPTSNAIHVPEDEFGNYVIDICVTLKFGCELAKLHRMCIKILWTILP